MHVCFVNLWNPPGVASPEALVEGDFIRRGFGAALAARGHRVTVVQEAPWPGRVERDGVTWELVPASPVTDGTRRLLAAAGYPHPRVPAPATAPLPVVRALRPDVIHSFDLCFYPSTALLAREARRLGAPLVAHFHGGAPARNAAMRRVERSAMTQVDRLLFTTRAHARPWVRSGAVAEDRVVELFETSTLLRPVPVSPREPGPIFLHAGRLDPVKDPLTALEGFARIAEHEAGARLVMVWRDGPLLEEVRRRIAGDARLRGRVELRGEAPHAEMAALYSAADFLLQASVREVCGVAIVEALACGCTPVVTDIPSFRRLTDGGRVGALFPRGDPAALAAQALRLVGRDRAALRAAARERFARALSFGVLGAELEAIYREVVGRSDQRMRSTRTGSASSRPAARAASSSA